MGSPRKCANCARSVRCARAIGTGERADVELCPSLSIFSLWATNSVPMPAVVQGNVRAGTIDIASGATGTSSFRWEKGVGMSIAF
jgi:hypothetical protein